MSWFRPSFQSRVLNLLERILRNQESETVALADLDAALAQEDTELTSLATGVSNNTAVIQKLRDALAASGTPVPEDLTAETNKVLADNAAIANALATVNANDADPAPAALETPAQ